MHTSTLRAQDGPADGEEGYVIEVITVTATRRKADLQKTPISVTAFSGEEVEEARLNSVEDISMLTPSLVITNNSELSRAYIRGIGNQNVFIGSDSSVAMNLDGVYMARPTNVFMDFLDVERVEVLRGPQGTLWGRNATGGSINVITRKPTEITDYQVDLLAANYSQQTVRGVINQPFNDQMIMRLAVLSSDRDGWVTNPSGRGPDKLHDREVSAARLSLRFMPSPFWDILFQADTNDVSGTGTAFIPSTPGLAHQLGAIFYDDPWIAANSAIDRTQEKDELFVDQAFFGYNLKAQYKTSNDLTFTSQTSWRGTRYDRFLDTDGTEIDVVDFRQHESHDQAAQEFQLASSPDARFEWVAGLYYFWEDVIWTGTIRTPFGTPTDEVEPGTIPVFAELDTNAYAAFFHGNYRYNDTTTLTVGLRYSKEEKHFSSFGGAAQDDTADWDALTPKLGVSYQADDNHLIYGTVSRGFKSGGYNGAVVQDPFDPEFVWSYELGWKGALAANRLNVSANTFYYDYSDLQVQTFTGLDLMRITNAAEAEVSGLEVDFVGRPAQNWGIAGGFAFLDGTYEEFIAAHPFDGPTDLAGADIPVAPDFSYNIRLRYEKVNEDGSAWLGRIAWQWQDDVSFSEFGNPNTTQKAFGTLDARLETALAGGKWRIGIYGRNLADQHHYTSMLNLNFSRDGVTSINGAPRTYGVEFSYRY
ncbi:MAG: TonB-dependent receptor [Acidobacteriota bacterium]|nr:TonB-dependent receptor [Acidobacteriota bacterium]